MSARKTEKKSYVHQPATRPLEHRTHFQLLDIHASRNPDKEAVVFRDIDGSRVSLIFTEYKEQSEAMAMGLLGLGFAKGDRIALLVPCGVDFVISQMALCRIGANAIILSSHIDPARFKALLTDLRCVGVVCSLATNDNNDNAEDIGKVMLDLLRDHNSATIKAVINYGTEDCGTADCETVECEDCGTADCMERFYSYEDVIKMGKESGQGREMLQQRQDEINPDDPSLVMFSSGSTGKPKPVQYTHHALVNFGFLIANCMSITQESRLYNDSAMDWSGLDEGVAFVSLLGATFVYVRPEVSIKAENTQFILKVIQEERCSNLLMLSYLLQYIILDEHAAVYLEKVSFCITGSQPVSHKLLRGVLRVLPRLTVILNYGSQEDGEVAYKMINRDNIEEEDCRFMDVGPGVEAMVTDGVGNLLPIGCIGEVCIRSPTLFLEYLEEPEKTRQAKTRTGWYRTGDVGVLNEKGQLNVLCRVKDTIQRDGQTIIPTDIENTISEHPSVAQVMLVGVPDRRYLEETCACVVLEGWSNQEAASVERSNQEAARVERSNQEAARVERSNQEARAELERWCSEALDSCPARVRYFVYLESIPLNKNAKFDRLALKDIAAKHLGLC